MLRSKNKMNQKFFREVFSLGQKRNSQSFFVKFLQKEGLAHFSVIPPKKIFKAAHKRNKSKRVFYNFLKENQSQMKEGLQIIFFLKEESKSIEKDFLRKEIQGFLQKESFLKKEI